MEFLLEFVVRKAAHLDVVLLLSGLYRFEVFIVRAHPWRIHKQRRVKQRLPSPLVLGKHSVYHY